MKKRWGCGEEGKAYTHGTEERGNIAVGPNDYKVWGDFEESWLQPQISLGQSGSSIR